MEIIAAVAVGLNPYVGTFVLAGLAAFTGHVPSSVVLEVVPLWVVAAVAAIAGMAAPLDLVLGKFARVAPQVRRVSQLIAPLSAAVLATAVTETDLPLPVVAAGSAFLAWAVAAMLTAAAARASRSAAWIGLGHIPVLMSAATAAACIVPLALAKPAIGYVLVAITLSTLGWVTVAGLRSAQVAQVVGRVPARVPGRVAAR